MNEFPLTKYAVNYYIILVPVWEKTIVNRHEGVSILTVTLPTRPFVIILNVLISKKNTAFNLIIYSHYLHECNANNMNK